MTRDETTPDPDEPTDAMGETPPIDPKVQATLGAMLQQHYDDLVSAPIPDQFLVLLAELEARERTGGR